MERQQHSVDTVFALVLFALFAISSVTLVLLGARVYSGIAGQMNRADASVMLSYVTEKIRHYDDGHSITLSEDNSILLAQETDQGQYDTWIYLEDGTLQECLMPRGKQPIANTGTKIGTAQAFSVTRYSDTLWKIEVTDGSGKQGERWITLTAKG